MTTSILSNIYATDSAHQSCLTEWWEDGAFPCTQFKGHNKDAWHWLAVSPGRVTSPFCVSKIISKLNEQKSMPFPYVTIPQCNELYFVNTPPVTDDIKPGISAKQSLCPLDSFVLSSTLLSEKYLLNTYNSSRTMRILKIAQSSGKHILNNHISS